MNQPEYDKVEYPALKQLGWQYIHGSKLSPEQGDERDYFKDVVLAKRLMAAIKRLNPWISDENQFKGDVPKFGAEYYEFIASNCWIDRVWYSGRAIKDPEFAFGGLNQRRQTCADKSSSVDFSI